MLEYPSKPPPAAAAPPPPRAFSQGVGTLFQTVGVVMFLSFTFFCCGSALTSKDWATRPARQQVGWGLSSGRVIYSQQSWTIATVTAGALLGLGLAGIGLGLQADKHRAALAGTALNALAAVFWIVQAVFAAQVLRSLLLSAMCAALALICGLLLGFAAAAAWELAKNPPLAGEEVLPAEFVEPFSHLHQDSPESRLLHEIAQRRQRLNVEQKELEALERRLRRKLEEK